MSDFRPTRASPPARPPRLTTNNLLKTTQADLSSASERQLRGLTSEEVDFLDAVFEQAGPTATTFMDVFAAYNNVLKERGLAPDEVVGYGKILKVGNLKGKTWREKWDGVKAKNGYHGGIGAEAMSSQASVPTRNLPTQAPTIYRQRKTVPSRLHRNLLPLDSGADVDSVGIANTETDIPQYHNTPRIRTRSPCPSEVTTASLDLNPLLRPPKQMRNLHPLLSPQATSEIASVTTEDYGAPSSKPPSYRSTAKEAPVLQPHHIGQPQLNKQTAIRSKVPLDASAARRVIAEARGRKGSVVNENEAWKKIRMERDEKDAEQFYQDRLVERCWETWKNGHHWIIVTNKQIDEARDNLVLRVTLQRWRNIHVARQALYERAGKVLKNRCIRHIFEIWISRFKLKQQEKWRQDMRMRMKTVREKHELKLEKDAWARWRQLYRSRLATQNYDERLMINYFKRWQARAWHIGGLETLADNVGQRRMNRVLIWGWTRWKRALELHFSEKAVVEQADLRRMKTAVIIWRKRATDLQAAEVYHEFVLTKRSLNSWKAARDRRELMSTKAVKMMARQDDLLLRAVLRVWKARERGKLLERVINLRCIKDNWSIWKRHLRCQRNNQDLAASFAMRPTSSVLIVAFRSWQQNLKTRQNADAYAVQFHSIQVIDRMLLTWRVVLREKLKSAKLARIASRFFAARRAWRNWRFHLEAKRREASLNAFQINLLKKWFLEWEQQTERARTQRALEGIVRDAVTKRVVRNALARWTNAVIEVKLRELEVAQQHDLFIQGTIFRKWKAICVRHAEEISLMESYQYVKREECLRKFFHRWLTATRMTRHRRITLHEKEEELKLILISRSWDRWRDRFVEERLRTKECNFLLESQRNLLFRLFGIWHSRTKSLPALRFYAIHAKTKHFGIWRAALPAALQAKTAREKYHEFLLSKCAKKWIERYRAKVALKAVARARYLRLPTSMPRLNNNGARPNAVNAEPLAVFPRRVVQAESTDDDFMPSKPSVNIHRAADYRTSIASLLKNKARHDESLPPPSISALKQRDISPARSNTSLATRLAQVDASSRSSTKSPNMFPGNDERRSKFWRELREIQKKSRAS
ncbi:hypothetical protein AX17_003293 [Amanita inopinata Kibby_2008]|nr:hypothetical protein AX17_003293 [Amanita inopinata Kibby_2008]